MPATVPAPTGLDPGDEVPFGPEAIDFTPPLVPGYEILYEVGRGGMGVVYKARQISLNRPVALKMILAGPHAGPQERERFRREAEAVAQLQHSHIVQIFEIGEANGYLYLALEFVEGGSLAQYLTGTPWNPTDAAVLIESLASAVHYAHTQGVVHRDLKPGNVLLADEDGGRSARPARAGQTASAGSPPLLPPAAFHPKITDFGLAKRLDDSANPDGTKSGAVMGTPSYIAPEQASGKTRDVGPTADIYSLGAILYELLTGRPPFFGETPLDTVLQVIHDDPVPPKRLQPTIPRDLETICLKCLEKSPAKRYTTASALADDLRRFRCGEPIKARPLGAWGRGVKWARRHPSLAALGLVTVAATVALVGVLSVAYARVRDAVAQKQQEVEIARRAREMEARERERAEALARDNEEKRQTVAEQNRLLQLEAERTRRAAFALQLAQIAAMSERDPWRARTLLEDEDRCPSELRDFTWAYLRRLCQREERVYLDHQPADPIHAVAFSPSGTLVATAGDAGQVRVWDPRSGRTWAVLTGNPERINGIAFSPDGSVIATAGADRSVRLWELPVDMLSAARRSISLFPILQPLADKPLVLFPTLTLADAHPAEATCVVFSPDSRFLVSGSEQGDIRWWDLGGWHLSNPVAAVVGFAGACSLREELQRVFAPRDRVVWEYRDMGVVHPGGVKALAFAAGTHILVSGGADRSARVWNVGGTSILRSFDNHADAVVAVAITPDGKLVATVNNSRSPTIRLISVSTGRDVHRLTGHTSSIYALTISNEGDLLASAGFDKSVRIWDVQGGKERVVLLGHEQGVSSLAFAPDRRTLLSGSMDATARLWLTTARSNDSADLVRDTSLTAAAITTSGNIFVTGDERNRLAVARNDLVPIRPGATPSVNPATLPFVFTPMLISDLRGQAIRSVAASPDGQIVFASTDTVLHIWQRLPGRRPGPGMAYSRPFTIPMPAPVYALAVDPTGRWLVTLDAGGIRVWELQQLVAAASRTGQPQSNSIHRVEYAQDFAFHPSGDRIVLAVKNGIRIIDLSGQVLANLPEAHPSGTKVETVAVGGTKGELLATADSTGLIKVWQVSPAGQFLLQARLAGHTGAVFSMAFSPNGRTLASGGFDRLVLLWDPISGQERATLTGHTDRIVRVQFLPDAAGLLTISRDGAVKRWLADNSLLMAQSPPRPNPHLGGG
jgi:WD40 repeat protein